jgi:death-on-curing protein
MLHEWIWVAEAAAPILHDEQIAELGGGWGGSEAGLLHSPLVRPQNLVAYGDPDMAALAAATAMASRRMIAS